MLVFPAMAGTHKPTRAKQSALIKIPAIVSAAFLVGSAFAEWPLLYYHLLRIVVFASALYIAWYCSRTRHQAWAILMVIVAVVYNPIYIIRFDSNQWHALDLVAALLLFISALCFPEPRETKRVRTRFD